MFYFLHRANPEFSSPEQKRIINHDSDECTIGPLTHTLFKADTCSWRASHFLEESSAKALCFSICVCWMFVVLCSLVRSSSSSLIFAHRLVFSSSCIRMKKGSVELFFSVELSSTKNVLTTLVFMYIGNVKTQNTILTISLSVPVFLFHKKYSTFL